VPNRSNIYGYLRSKDGPGHECIALAFPIDEPASVATGLTFISQMHRTSPHWQSKDLLILFYPSTNYALAIQEFLKDYYPN
jgi:hypothetical protein